MLLVSVEFKKVSESSVTGYPRYSDGISNVSDGL